MCHLMCVSLDVPVLGSKFPLGRVTSIAKFMLGRVTSVAKFMLSRVTSIAKFMLGRVTSIAKVDSLKFRNRGFCHLVR